MKDRLPGLRVLVVEDNPVIAFDIDDTLRERGIDVVGPALDLQSGLALAHAETPDVAVLDIDISGNPVWPIARHLQSEGVPFMFVSGECRLGVPDDLSGALCIDKPAPAEAILSAVVKMSGQR